MCARLDRINKTLRCASEDFDEIHKYEKWQGHQRSYLEEKISETREFENLIDDARGDIIISLVDIFVTNGYVNQKELTDLIEESVDGI